MSGLHCLCSGCRRWVARHCVKVAMSIRLWPDEARETEVSSLARLQLISPCLSKKVIYISIMFQEREVGNRLLTTNVSLVGKARSMGPSIRACQTMAVAFTGHLYTQQIRLSGKAGAWVVGCSGSVQLPSPGATCSTSPVCHCSLQSVPYCVESEVVLPRWWARYAVGHLVQVCTSPYRAPCRHVSLDSPAIPPP